MLSSSQDAPAMAQILQNSNQVSLPIMIDGQEFYLEIDGIRNVEVVDLNPSDFKESKNVLDEINNTESLKGELSNLDKNFFRNVFKEVDARGPDFVEPPKLPGKVNNLDN